MDYINGRLTDLFPNSSIYLKTREGALTYLNLWDPDHNYRYKLAPANNWASYIGFSDWESGQRFSLRKYYKMCDEIQEVVKGHEELLRVHRQRFENGEPDYDKAYHILTFDVLYCFWGYEDARREALEEYQEAMKQQHFDDLEERLSEVSKQIELKTGQLSSPECLGGRVHHKKFGHGEVKEVEGARLVILFDDAGSKLFKYPDAFVNGFLKPEDSSIMEQFERNSVLESELAALREQEKKLREELAAIDKPE